VRHLAAPLDGGREHNLVVVVCEAERDKVEERLPAELSAPQDRLQAEGPNSPNREGSSRMWMMVRLFF
jgi:hypothetical protein